MEHDLRPVHAELAPRVAGYLRLQGVEDPEGAANEVFLRAVRSLDRFDGSSEQLRSWIFSIAHNLAIDDRRRRSRRPRTVPLDELVERAGSAPEVADLVGSAANLVEMLGSLPDDQRDVLMLRIVLDLPIAEVAEAMGRRPGAVKSLQKRALDRLRREISAEAVPR